jgi:hypothetical protein
MTREEIMHMAREAGVRMDYIFDSGTTRWILQRGLMRFAALVAEAEREACARVCEAEYEGYDWADREKDATKDCARAIRARGSE